MGVRVSGGRMPNSFDYFIMLLCLAVATTASLTTLWLLPDAEDAPPPTIVPPVTLPEQIDDVAFRVQVNGVWVDMTCDLVMGPPMRGDCAP